MSKQAQELFDNAVTLLEGTTCTTGEVAAAFLGVIYAGAGDLEEVKAIHQIIALTSASLASSLGTKLAERTNAKLN